MKVISTSLLAIWLFQIWFESMSDGDTYDSLNDSVVFDQFLPNLMTELHFTIKEYLPKTLSVVVCSLIDSTAVGDALHISTTNYSSAKPVKSSSKRHVLSRTQSSNMNFVNLTTLTACCLLTVVPDKFTWFQSSCATFRVIGANISSEELIKRIALPLSLLWLFIITSVLPPDGRAR